MKKPPAPKLVTVAILTTITVIFWVFFSVYEIITSQEKLTIPQELMNPIDPNLDLETLEKLPLKYFVEEGQEKPLPITNNL